MILSWYISLIYITDIFMPTLPLTQISKSQYYWMSNNSKMVQDRVIVTMKVEWTYNESQPIESHIWSIKRPHFQWPWMTPDADFKVTQLFNNEYLRNDTRYRHSYNEILIWTYTLIKNVILNDLERLSKRFNDTKHCVVSLR